MMSRLQDFHDPLPQTFDEVLTGIANENRPLHKEIVARPFLKWVGGKRSILPELLARLPKEFNTYNEPFLGGGALFFAVKPEKAFLSDINFHLIITFQAVRDNVEQLIELLTNHAKKHNKEYFQKARRQLVKETDPTKIAGWFIYLNKTCFNGLYRVNKSGGFNVPMGDYKVPPILDPENLRAASAALQGATITQQSFSQIKPQKNSFYYIDPPYHETYDGYNGSGFADKEHFALAEFCHEIHKKGGYFMLSNSDTDLVRTLYKAYTIEQVAAMRSVSCKSHQRGRENELLIRNYN